MSEVTIRPPSAKQRWPMTAKAWRSLVDEVGRLRADLEVVAGMRDLDEGLVHVPVARTARRLEILAGVFAVAEQVEAPDRAVIGRRATLLEDDGESVTYALVFPGDGDPTQGWISADSPMGAAILGSGPGDMVEVIAPVGRRIVTVLAVD